MHVHFMSLYSFPFLSTVQSKVIVYCGLYFVVILDSIYCFMHILSHFDCGLIRNNDEKYKCKIKVRKLKS